MPALIRIEMGPDAGTSVRLDTGEVRIGRGVGCQVQVKDPGFRGHLRIFFKGATYWVANETDREAGVFAPGQSSYVMLPVGAERLWDDGYRIQPTNETLILLEVVDAAVDDGGEPAADGEVLVTRGRTPAEEKKARDRIYLTVTLLASALAVILFLQPSVDSGPPAPTRAQVARRFNTVSKGLEELAAHPQYGRSAVVARGLIRDSRLEEIGDRSAAAYAGYQQARDELDRALGDRLSDDRRPAPADPPAEPDPAVEPLRAARAFVADRLVLLAREKSSYPE